MRSLVIALAVGVCLSGQASANPCQDPHLASAIKSLERELPFILERTKVKAKMETGGKSILEDLIRLGPSGRNKEADLLLKGYIRAIRSTISLAQSDVKFLTQLHSVVKISVERVRHACRQR